MSSHKWQPIETAPKDGTYVLLCSRYKTGHEIGVYAAHVEGGWLCTNDEYSPYPAPTHWMPLPEPPNEVSDK